MNNQLITKIINTNDGSPCPELAYENPLIDRKVAGALAQSFVKILRVSRQDSNLNNNLRHSVLSNIRNLCRLEPENHLIVDENLTKSLTKVYIERLKESNESLPQVEKTLDYFLSRRMIDLNFDLNEEFSMKPEVLQSLLNLNDDHSCLESVAKNILHWNVSDKKTLALVKNLWTNLSLAEFTDASICDDISVKMKSEVEILLLNICHNVLTEPNLSTDKIFSVDYTLKDLVRKCSISAACFQICYQILNSIFMNTNFNVDIEIFVSKFIKSVKENCSNNISIMYPTHLSSVVVLIDIEMDSMPNILKNKYIAQTMPHLKRLHEQSETDLILLLSHYPQWFHIYN